MIFVGFFFFFFGRVFICLVVYWFFYGNSVLVFVFDLTIERWVLLKF